MNEITRTPLAPGVRLTCITTQKFKTSAMGVSLLLPLRGEPVFAALPHVLRRGTAQYPSLDAIGGALESLYGMRIEPAVRARGETLAVGLVADVIDEAYGGDGLTSRAAALLLSFLNEPYLENGQFPSVSVRSEAENLADRIAAHRNDLRSWALRRLWELMCADEAYGKNELGTVEGALALTPEDFMKAYRTALDDAPMELFYCGAQLPETVADAFRAALPRRETKAYPLPETQIFAQPPHGKRYFEESLPVTQGKLCLGFRTGITSDDPRYPALLLTNAVYGGTTSSRLFRNVREKMSLCYYASTQCYRLKGVLAASSGIDNENAEVARAEILRQLEGLQHGGAQPDELETARRSVVNGLRAMADSPMSLESFWLDQAIAGLSWSPEDLAARVAEATADEVQGAARCIVPDTVFFLRGAAK